MSEPRPSSTCLSTQLKLAFVRPPTNQRAYGASDASSVAVHGRHCETGPTFSVARLILGPSAPSCTAQPRQHSSAVS